MLDTKKIIQLGLGVAIGMIAWHFIQQQMNKSALGGETASASGGCKGCSCADGRCLKNCAWGNCGECCGDSVAKTSSLTTQKISRRNVRY